jgi:hypothetical protein
MTFCQRRHRAAELWRLSFRSEEGGLGAGGAARQGRRSIILVPTEFLPVPVEFQKEIETRDAEEEHPGRDIIVGLFLAHPVTQNVEVDAHEHTADHPGHGAPDRVDGTELAVLHPGK